MRVTLLLLLTIMSVFAADAVRPPNRAWDFTLPVDGQVIDVRVRGPIAPTAPCPVIVFSHGLGGSREGYWLLAEAWASAGYIVIQPSHPGSDTSAFRGGSLLSLSASMRAAMSDPALLAGRPHLISRLIDLLPEIRTHLGDWPGSFDTAHIGVGGHSYGAWTTLVTAGGRYLIPGHPEPLSDARPVAFLAMSPPGIGRVTAGDAPYAAITRPMLVMTGTEDRQPAMLDRDDGIDRGPAWREQVFKDLPAGDKFLAVLAGAHHCAFSNGQGARLSGEPSPESWIEPLLETVTIAWWDAWLRGDQQVLTHLRDGQVVPATERLKVRWENR